jgi:CRP-like cAMP-binding protein
MIDVHLRKLRARSDINAEEEQFIRSLPTDIVDYQQDRTVIRHGQELNQSTLLLEGWMAELNIPGDFVDLHGFTLKRLDHDIIAITRCRVAVVPHDRLGEMTERFPRLTRIYWFMTNVDAAIHREWTLSLGRRTALARMAQLMCELNVRLGIAGLSEEGCYDFPLTQVELAECLGLTAVHVNRTLQELRRRGLVDLQNRRVTIFDLPALEAVAEFDDAYLYLDKRPR